MVVEPVNEPDLSDVLIEILAFARSGPPVEELLSYFTTRALTVVSGTVVVRPLRHAPRPPLTAGAGPGNAKAFPVSCGRVPWGELQLTDDDGPVAEGDAHRGHLLAEVLGAALAADAEAGAPAARDPHTTAFLSSAGNPGDDDMVELVLGCVEDLDRMPDASTRARLALVVRRVADVVGAPAWSVGLSHHGWLHDVSGAPGPDGAVIDDPAAATGPVPIARFPARRRASGGGAFYADRLTGDEAERRALAARGHFAVIGAGGYDLDGRAWVADVRAGVDSALERATAVLAALVMAALSSPREASVPRPEEHWVRAALRLPAAPGGHGDDRGFGATG